MSADGVGWHLPTGLIALAALFIACFAISGYITFRDHSVPETALDPGTDLTHDFTLPVNVTGTVTADNFLIRTDAPGQGSVPQALITDGVVQTVSGLGKLRYVTLDLPTAGVTLGDLGFAAGTDLDGDDAADAVGLAKGTPIYRLPNQALTILNASLSLGLTSGDDANITTRANSLIALGTAAENDAFATGAFAANGVNIIPATAPTALDYDITPATKRTDVANAPGFLVNAGAANDIFLNFGSPGAAAGTAETLNFKGSISLTYLLHG